MFKKKVSMKGYRGIFTLGKTFAQMDEDGSGSISRAEFEKGCRDFKINDISSEDIGKIFAAFD